VQTVTSIALRPFAPGDLPILREIRNDMAMQALLLSHPEARTGDDTETWVARRVADSSGLFLVVERKGICIGFVQITGWHRLDCYAHFGIGLHRAARGMGVGKATMLALFDIVRAKGLRKLLCEIRADNVAALMLYRGLDFRDIGTLKAHYDDGARCWDVVSMEKLLMA